MTSPVDPPLRAELRAGLTVVAGSAVLGALAGVVWRLVTPLERLRREGTAAVPVGRAESAVAADGWFAVCTALAGVLVAVAAVALVRRGRLGTLVGLAAGGLLAAVLAWRVGLLLSPPDSADGLREVADGERFDGPLRLSAIGVLLAWPTAAVIAFFAVVAGLDVDPAPRERRPEPEPDSSWQLTPPPAPPAPAEPR